MKVYYAHPLNLYNTPQEQRDLHTLEALFGAENILNPNSPEVEAIYKSKKDDNLFNALIQQADVFAFRGTPFGKITAGVAANLKFAQDNHKIIIELPSTLGRAMSVDATREYLREVGQR